MSVILGLAGFAASYCSFTFQVGHFHISLVWAYMFPLLAAMAYGSRYGFYAGFIGLAAFYPFHLWPDNGWANVVNTILFLSWLMWHGYASDKYIKQNKWFWHPIHVQLQYAVVYCLIIIISYPYLLSQNPPSWAPEAQTFMPRNIMVSILVKENIHFFLMVILVQFVLITNHGQRILKLAMRPEYKNNGTILVLSFLAAGCITVLWLIVKSVLIEDVSLTDVFSSFKLIETPYMLIILASCIVSGFIVAKYSSQLLQTMNSLDKAEKFNRLLFNTSPVGLNLCKLDGSFVNFNPAFSNITGRTIDELKQMKYYDITPKKYVEQEFEILKNIADTGVYGPIEKEFLHKSGKLIPVILKGLSVEYDNEYYIWSTIEDITERKQARKDIFETNERLLVLIEAIPDAIFFKDGEGRWLITNEPAKKLFKIHGLDWVGKTDAQLGEERPEYQTAHEMFTADDEKAWESGKMCVCDEFVSDEEGLMRQYEVCKVPIFYPGGKRKAMLIIGTDVTERRLHEEALKNALVRAEASDALKTAFLNNISHEIRTPLNSIMGFGSLMIDPDLTLPEKENYYENLESSSTRLINTVTDYMDISLLVSGNQDVNKKQFAIVDLLKKVYNSYHAACKQKKLVLNLKIYPQELSLHVNSDFELLFKALSHLVGNALKFTHYGEIVFGLEVKDVSVLFFVKDTGVGIAPSAQKLIFDKFMQENMSNTRVYEGSGLGLSIVKEIVNLLGGKVWFESTKGEGSSFYFNIPSEIVTPSATVQHEELKPVTVNPLILIAEDEYSNSFFLEKMLNKQGFQTFVVSDGMQAVDVCKTNASISMVLMDLKMPELNGFEATREIKANRPSLPIIAITAFAMSNDEGKALAAGCDDYIAKPFTQELLLEKLSNFGLKPNLSLERTQ